MNILDINSVAVFGCSNTYGHWLCSESSDEAGDNIRPSKHSWANILANGLKLNPVVFASPGTSMKQQLLCCLDTPFNHCSKALVLATYPYRSCLYSTNLGSHPVAELGISHGLESLMPAEAHHTFINSKEHNIMYKHFYKSHTNIELERQWVTQIDCMRLFFRANRIQYIFAFPLESYKELYTRLQSPSLPTLKERPYFHNRQVDRAMDGMHAGIETHRRYAKAVSHSILSSGWEK